MNRLPIKCDPPTTRLLRWLTDAGPDVPAAVQSMLLARIFAGPAAMLMGVLNATLVNGVGLILVHRPVFATFIALDLVLAASRLAVARAAGRAAEAGKQQPIDAYVILIIIWCGLQGATAFTAMQSGSFPLQIIAATTVMGLIGPICARNFAVPKLTLLLVCECHLPFLIGSVLSGEPWMLILVLQSPLFYYGAFRITWAYNRVAVRALSAEQASSYHARHDPLTGLPNRLALKELGEAAGGHIAVLCLDLDGFKQVNDTFGHHIGDLLLQNVALRLAASIRAGDAAIRLGGDEFLIIARNVGPAGAAELSGRVIHRVAAEPYSLEGNPVRIGVSVGFACGPEDGSILSELHRRADAALYDAKGDGKGLSRRHGECMGRAGVAAEPPVPVPTPQTANSAAYHR